MFDNYEKNKVMIEGAYKKLKSYYHYNKSFIFMKKKIAEFEYDFDNLEERLDNLAKLLLPSNASYLNEQVENWINLIDYYVMPKSFKKKEQNNSKIVTSDMVVNAPVNKVNFFIDMPVELHILDSLWTILVGKIVYDQNLLTENCYGNVIDNFVVYNKSADFYESINFTKNKLFKIYFNQYCDWKNNMIDLVRLCDSKKMNVALISLDIKSYFYSVCLKFSDIKEQLGKNSNYDKISTLTSIMEKIFLRYTEKLRLVRQLNHKEDEMVLPIGLFSSMLLANLYLSEIDKKFSASPIVKYYGRYVDDMLVLIETAKNPQDFKEDDFLEQVLVKKLNIMEKMDEKNFSFVDKSNLVIQTGKIKIIYFKGGKSRSLIKKLEKTKIIPSQVNIIPSQEISMMDFEEAAYLISGFTEETKIRDIGQLEINRFGLGCYLTQFLQISCDRSLEEEKSESMWKKTEINKILSFFQKSICLEYLNNWINVFYIMVINNSIDGFIQFERNVRDAINKLKIEEIEGVYKSKNKLVKNKMKSALSLYFEVSLAVSLAVFPKFSGNKEKHIIDLSVKIRHANLFNHHLVTFPLVNYADDLNDDINLSSLTIDDVLNVKYSIAYGKKLKWTPRFITLDEIFLWIFLQNEYMGGNYYSGINSKTLESIINFFYSANRINKDYAKPIEIEIKNNKEVNGYLLQFIYLGKHVNISKKRNVKVAIANIGIKPNMCIQKLENPNKISCNKTDFYYILKRAYENQVEFVLFPEFYLPVEWLDEVLAFARKTKITVITGLNYITTSGLGTKRAMNNVAVIAPFKSGSYLNSFVFVREKNDYAPLEKEILALKNVKCFNQEIPSYQVFYNKGIQYGIFLCFEFTDIIARALYKNKVDFLFIPEHNKDTAYFASIIESMTRDLHAFIIQANTSIYGDSRITGPYGRNDRNIVQIKGGDDSDVIIGTIELGKIREFQSSAKDNFEKKINEYYKLPDKEKEEKLKALIEEKEKKISILSARTYE